MQTNIDQFFKSRKRPAADELAGHPSKLVARKLFEYDSQKSEPTTEATTPSTPIQSPSSEEALRKKLNLGEFKEKIRRSKKYSTLKEKLEKFKANSTATRLEEIKESLNELGSGELKKFDNIQVEVPSSPVKCGNLRPRRLFWTSPGRSPAKEQSYVSPKKLLDEGPKQLTPVKATFEKYNHLLATGKESLILPHKYLVLKEIFRSVDIVAKIRNDRNEVVTFTKLKRDMQKMLGRNFTETHLGKIKAVYPESYEFSRERIKVAFSNEEKYELIIKRLPHTVKKDYESEPTELMNSERLKIFHNRLLQKTKTYHQEFLSKLDPPIIIESDKLTMWHADFEVDNVPDIDPVPMPPIPVSQSNLSAKDVLEKTRNLIRVNNRMERAISALEEEKKKTSQPSTPTTTSTSTTPTTSNPLPAFQKALQKIPKGILEKVRAKQAAKMVEMMTRTPDEAKEAIMLSRLPELARIMRNIFVDEKKGILPMEVVLLKVGYSYREKLGNNELLQHMKLISKHLPGWLNLPTVSNIPYVRLSKDADMTRVLGKLQRLANPS